MVLCLSDHWKSFSKDKFFWLSLLPEHVAERVIGYQVRLRIFIGITWKSFILQLTGKVLSRIFSVVAVSLFSFLLFLVPAMLCYMLVSPFLTVHQSVDFGYRMFWRWWSFARPRIARGGTKHEVVTALLAGKSQVRHRSRHRLRERRK
jgi:hypothetical protein